MTSDLPSHAGILCLTEHQSSFRESHSISLLNAVGIFGALPRSRGPHLLGLCTQPLPRAGIWEFLTSWVLECLDVYVPPE